MPRPSKTVSEVLRDLLDSLAPPDLKIEVTSGGTTVNLMNSQYVYLHLDMLYGGYRWYYPTLYAYNASVFYGLWQQWLQRNASNIVRQYNALLEDYNPIYNYDLTEQAADGSRHDKTTDTTTPSGEMTVTTGHTGTDTTTPSGQMQVASAHTGTDTTTDSKWGFDSSAAVPSDQSALLHGETVTDTTTFTGYKTELTHGETVTDTTTFDDYQTERTTEHENDQSMQLPDGTTATGYADASEHYLRRYGNIGVQTAADILGGELAIRVHDLALEWLRRFGDEYFVYVGDVL